MMEDAMANLKLLDDEEEAIHEVEGAVSIAYQFCLAGRCLTDSVVYFPSLRNTMADLCHPIRGICITELGEKRYLFQFFNKGENPVVIELKFTEFWIQVHDLPPRSMNESMAKQFGNFCGRFIEYDTSIPTLGTQTFLRIRVCLDVTAPLKRKKKVLFGKSLVVYTRFKYEKLSLFCFICGRLGHGESFCPLRLQIESSKIVFGWDLSLHAAIRCRNTVESRWLQAADGTPRIIDNLGNSKQGSLIYEGKGLGRNFRGAAGIQNEDDPITLLEGKKIQIIIESLRVPLDVIVGP
ncbi:hypothetical protein Golob_006998, partial [Gossypium lobatum]|nr:hypothetical protein [Gossypium lobatum]